MAWIKPSYAQPRAWFSHKVLPDLPWHHRMLFLTQSRSLGYWVNVTSTHYSSSLPGQWPPTASKCSRSIPLAVAAVISWSWRRRPWCWRHHFAAFVAKPSAIPSPARVATLAAAELLLTTVLSRSSSISSFSCIWNAAPNRNWSMVSKEPSGSRLHKASSTVSVYKTTTTTTACLIGHGPSWQ